MSGDDELCSSCRGTGWKESLAPCDCLGAMFFDGIGYRFENSEASEG